MSEEKHFSGQEEKSEEKFYPTEKDVRFKGSVHFDLQPKSRCKAIIFARPDIAHEYKESKNYEVVPISKYKQIGRYLEENYSELSQKELFFGFHFHGNDAKSKSYKIVIEKKSHPFPDIVKSISGEFSGKHISYFLASCYSSNLNKEDFKGVKEPFILATSSREERSVKTALGRIMMENIANQYVIGIELGKGYEPSFFKALSLMLYTEKRKILSNDLEVTIEPVKSLKNQDEFNSITLENLWSTIKFTPESDTQMVENLQKNIIEMSSESGGDDYKQRQLFYYLFGKIEFLLESERERKGIEFACNIEPKEIGDILKFLFDTKFFDKKLVSEEASMRVIKIIIDRAREENSFAQESGLNFDNIYDFVKNKYYKEKNFFVGALYTDILMQPLMIDRINVFAKEFKTLQAREKESFSVVKELYSKNYSLPFDIAKQVLKKLRACKFDSYYIDSLNKIYLADFNNDYEELKAIYEQIMQKFKDGPKDIDSMKLLNLLGNVYLKKYTEEFDEKEKQQLITKSFDAFKTVYGKLGKAEASKEVSEKNLQDFLLCYVEGFRYLGVEIEVVVEFFKKVKKGFSSYNLDFQEGRIIDLYVEKVKECPNSVEDAVAAYSNYLDEECKGYIDSKEEIDINSERQDSKKNIAFAIERMAFLVISKPLLHEKYGRYIFNKLKENIKNPFCNITKTKTLLASCYENGIGCKKNKTEAFKLYLDLYINHGHEFSGLSVALAYLSGDGVVKNPYKAVEVFKSLSESTNKKCKKYAQNFLMAFNQFLSKNRHIKEIISEVTVQPKNENVQLLEKCWKKCFEIFDKSEKVKSSEILDKVNCGDEKAMLKYADNLIFKGNFYGNSRVSDCYGDYQDAYMFTNILKKSKNADIKSEALYLRGVCLLKGLGCEQDLTKVKKLLGRKDFKDVFKDKLKIWYNYDMMVSSEKSDVKEAEKFFEEHENKDFDTIVSICKTRVQKRRKRMQGKKEVESCIEDEKVVEPIIGFDLKENSFNLFDYYRLREQMAESFSKEVKKKLQLREKIFNKIDSVINKWNKDLFPKEYSELLAIKAYLLLENNKENEALRDILDSLSVNQDAIKHFLVFVEKGKVKIGVDNIKLVSVVGGMEGSIISDIFRVKEIKQTFLSKQRQLLQILGEKYNYEDYDIAYRIAKIFLYDKEIQTAKLGFAVLQILAEKGHKKSCYEIGDVYEDNKDEKQAVKFYEKAADKGYVPALLKIARFNAFGELGGEINLEKAKSIYQKLYFSGQKLAAPGLFYTLFHEKGYTEEPQNDDGKLKGQEDSNYISLFEDLKSLIKLGNKEAIFVYKKIIDKKQVVFTNERKSKLSVCSAELLRTFVVGNDRSYYGSGGYGSLRRLPSIMSSTYTQQGSGAFDSQGSEVYSRSMDSINEKDLRSEFIGIGKDLYEKTDEKEIEAFFSDKLNQYAGYNVGKVIFRLCLEGFILRNKGPYEKRAFIKYFFKKVKGNGFLCGIAGYVKNDLDDDLKAVEEELWNSIISEQEKLNQDLLEESAGYFLEDATEKALSFLEENKVIEESSSAITSKERIFDNLLLEPDGSLRKIVGDNARVINLYKLEQPDNCYYLVRILTERCYEKIIQKNEESISKCYKDIVAFKNKALQDFSFAGRKDPVSDAREYKRRFVYQYGTNSFVKFKGFFRSGFYPEMHGNGEVGEPSTNDLMRPMWINDFNKQEKERAFHYAFECLFAEFDLKNKPEWDDRGGSYVNFTELDEYNPSYFLQNAKFESLQYSCCLLM